MAIKISGVVIAKNEERKIGDCLNSLSWCDEVIVVDTGSIDKTIEIANKHKAKVVIYGRGSYSDWRNEGLKYARGEWVLYIDADERVSPSLQREIVKLLNDSIVEFSAYAIPRKNIIFDKEFKHGGQWPDYVKRLFYKANFKSWTKELHEEPIFDGKLGYLDNPIIHLKHNNLSEMVDKTNVWSAIEAKLMYNSNHPKMNISRFVTAVLREGWLRMVKQLAFLDGTEGIIYAIYQVYSRFISYAKLWEMQLGKDINELDIGRLREIEKVK